MAQLYPNPNQGKFLIATGNQSGQILDLTIFDVSGKEVFHTKAKDAIINVVNLSLVSGLYIVKLTGNNYSETFKFIKL